jgi:predicted GIY-YIG superfamily endonuclease
VPKYCYVYILRSQVDRQLYVGLTRDLLARLQPHDVSPRQRNAVHLSLYIGRVVEMRAMRVNERNI